MEFGLKILFLFGVFAHPCGADGSFAPRRALAPSRSQTKLDSLMRASSSRASNRFCNCTRLHVS